MKNLFVDTRWRGNHGIGRYSTEVLNRLNVKHNLLQSKISPSSPFDLVNPVRFRLSRTSTLYSPGFNAGLSWSRQIVTIHDLIHLKDMTEGNVLKRLYYNAFLKRIVKKARIVFTVSQSSQNDISQWISDDKVQIVVTGCGISSEFTPSGKIDSRIEGKFLFVGGARSHKNLVVLLKALEVEPSLSLFIVTNDVVAVQKEINQRQLAHQVEIASGISDNELAGLYRGCLGLVIPSTLEGFGLPAAEAIASGTKVVYWSGCTSVKEIVAGMGFEIESSDDYRQWAKVMLALKNNPATQVSPPTEWVQEYSWDSVAKKVDSSLVEYLSKGA